VDQGPGGAGGRVGGKDRRQKMKAWGSRNDRQRKKTESGGDSRQKGCRWEKRGRAGPYLLIHSLEGR
jgi:hypothetical protein